MSALRMTEKVSECLQDILSIADGPHPRIFDHARQRIERLFSDANTHQGEHSSVAQMIRDELGRVFDKQTAANLNPGDLRCTQ